MAWEAPANPGYTGVFDANERLSAMDTVSVLGERGPESIAVDASGRMYFATASGWIVRTDSLGRQAERWANTHGRPLGMAFDLEAHGAVEAAGRARAFGPLPEAWPRDRLRVSFFFDPASL